MLVPVLIVANPFLSSRVMNTMRIDALSCDDIDCEIMFAQTQEMLDAVLQYHASNDHDAPTIQCTQAAPKKTWKPTKALMWTDDDGS